ncbi:MAG TPA: chaperone NapD [Longimicrobiales bacterium]|nr:chaperone NapD [Longimicrobiales bacterium]
MPVCGYVVVPRPGEKERLRAALARIHECEVVPAENAEILLLVTSADTTREDERLRRQVEELPGVQALLLTFGEVDPDMTNEAGVLP